MPTSPAIDAETSRSWSFEVTASSSGAAATMRAACRESSSEA
jgi:hypothetical protein